MKSFKQIYSYLLCKSTVFILDKPWTTKFFENLLFFCITGLFWFIRYENLQFNFRTVKYNMMPSK